MSYITTVRPIFNKIRGQGVVPIEYVRLVVSALGVKELLDRSFFYWNNDSREVLLYGGLCSITNTGSYDFQTVAGSRSLALVVGAGYRERRNKLLDGVCIDGILQLDYRVESFSCDAPMPIILTSDDHIDIRVQSIDRVQEQINQLGRYRAIEHIVEIQQILQNILELIK
jgi:hypothetical protein